MISPLSEDARERYGYIYAKEKIFFDFTKFSRGIFSKDWTERRLFLRWVSGWDVWDTGLQGAGTGADVAKKNGSVVVSSEKCCKFAGQLRGADGGKCADCSKINCSPSRDGATLDL